jgi:hypothetical protein
MRTIALALLSELLFVSSPVAAGEDIYVWSKTASSNASADSGINFQEGQLPGSLNDSMRSVMAAIAKARDDQNCTLATAGSANAYTVTANASFSSTPFSGARLCVKASFGNTGAATLNVTPNGGSAWGAKAIKIINSGAGESDPQAGQIAANSLLYLFYDSAANSSAGAWILLNPSSAGDYQEAKVDSGSAITLTAAVAANIASLTLTPGDWDLVSIARFVPANTTPVSVLATSVSTTSATQDTSTMRQVIHGISYTSIGSELAVVTPPVRLLLTSTTTVYAVATANHSGIVTVYGGIRARRAR